MADAKLTPEWCEAEATVWAEDDRPRMAQALRLAALALRRHEAMRAERAAFFAMDGRAESQAAWGRLADAVLDARRAMIAYAHEITRPSAAEEER